MSDLPTSCRVAIIGAGPAGLATAIALKKLGVDDLLVLERSAEAGGNPRHCGHSPFGLSEFRRIYLGPAYARKMVQTARQLGIRIIVNATVVALGENGLLTLSMPQGRQMLQAVKVVLATGIRETPRAPRFVSGQRPLGIVTTGALQSMIYLNHKKPFERAVIVGSELVSFSAIASCRHAGIKPLAMIEANPRVTAASALSLYPRLLGVDMLLNARILDIEGKQRVTGVNVLTSTGGHRHIDCDGVIFSGQFTPESSLARLGHLEIDARTQGPVVDQFGRCSDAAYFAAGNVLRPVETAGWCWREGMQMAQSIKADLEGRLPQTQRQISIRINSDAIKYAMPQRLSLADNGACPWRDAAQKFQLRLTRPVQGRLIIQQGERELLSRKINSLPERRILMPMPEIDKTMEAATLDFSIRE